jgi:hypothetical protein
VVELNFSVFWVITWNEIVWNRRFGITYRSHLQGSGCPKTHLHPARCNRYVVPKRRFQTISRHVRNQKTEEYLLYLLKHLCICHTTQY